MKLLQHCRICGGRLNKAKGKKIQPVHSCKEYILDLQSLAGVPSDLGEEESIAPSRFCNPCYLKLQRVKKASQEGLPSQSMVAMDGLHTKRRTAR